jgi:hypothetical protein
MQLLISTKYRNQKRSVFECVGGALEEHKGKQRKESWGSGEPSKLFWEKLG